MKRMLRLPEEGWLLFISVVVIFVTFIIYKLAS